MRSALFLLMLLKSVAGFAQNDVLKRRMIVIDPGHGGKDSGAVSKDGIQEKDIVLDIAYEMIRLNKIVLKDKYDLYLTRYMDTFVSLSDRSFLVSNLKPELFISLHCNDALFSARGLEVYVDHKAFKKSGVNSSFYIRESIVLAHYILTEYDQYIGMKLRGVKFAGFSVLRKTRNVCPGVLVETGFVSNKDEVRYLSQKKGVRAVALAILLSIDKYFNQTKLQ